MPLFLLKHKNLIVYKAFKLMLNITNKTFQNLQTVTQRNGAIDFSQGDTKAIGVYSKEFSILPFTQGFCLRTLY